MENYNNQDPNMGYYNQNSQMGNYNNQCNQVTSQDIEELKAFQKYAKIAAICWCIFILIIPALVASVFSIIAGVKGLNLKNKKLHDEYNIFSILILVFGILLGLGALIVGFMINSKVGVFLSNIQEQQVQQTIQQPAPNYNQDQQ